jgi:hypothetical protein
VPTFEASIWCNGENRVPAKSRLNIGQSDGSAAVDCGCACTAGVNKAVSKQPAKISFAMQL